MKKIFAIIMSVLMIACFMPSMAFASGPDGTNATATAKTWTDNGKFKMSLSSGATTATAEVYDDFSVSAKVVGDTVNAASVKIGIEMKDVSSLNVVGTKSKETTLNTGISGMTSLSLPKYFPHIFGYASPSAVVTSETNVSNFDGGIIKGTIDGEIYEYTLNPFTKMSDKEDEKDVYTLKATPTDVEQTRKAWNNLVKYVEAETEQDTSNENSENFGIVIKEGTTIQIGTLVIDFSSDFGIKKSDQEGKVQFTGNELSLDENAEQLSDNIQIYLPKDTKLQVGYSSATLKRGLYLQSDINIPAEKIKSIYAAVNKLKNEGENSEDRKTTVEGLVLCLVTVVDYIVEDVDDAESKYIDIKGAYTLTMNTANGEKYKDETYEYGVKILTLTPPPAPTGQTFDYWKDGSGNRLNANATITSDMTITPVYRTVSSGGSSGGGGGAAVTPSTTDNVTNKTETKTDSSQTGTETTTTVPTTTATVKTETKTAADGTKTTTATVDTTTATKIVEKAVENKSEEVVVSAAETPVAETAAGTTTEVAIPAETVSQIAEKTTAAVTIESEAAKVTLDQEAVAAVAEAAGETGTVSLVVETKAQDETKVEVDLKIETSNGTVSDFKGGTVSVTVKLNSALASKPVICVYIDDNGVYHKVQGQKNADGTYTFQTGHFSTYAIMSEEEANAVIAQQNEKAEDLAKDLKLKASSSKTKKGNIKVKLTVDADEIKAIEDLGYTVKYKFYRSTKKSSSYKAKFETAGKTYTNTSGKKGTRYYYKARVLVYDSEGTLITYTTLKQCKYATRVR